MNIREEAIKTLRFQEQVIKDELKLLEKPKSANNLHPANECDYKEKTDGNN